MSERKWYDDGTRKPGLDLNPTAHGFGNCGICGEPIRTADLIYSRGGYSRDGRFGFDHADCRERQNDLYEEAMQRPDIRTVVTDLVAAVTSLVEILEAVKDRRP